jgi:hypothetical protein
MIANYTTLIFQTQSAHLISIINILNLKTTVFAYRYILKIAYANGLRLNLSVLQKKL